MINIKYNGYLNKENIMGMFDWVDYECVCPVCKSKVTGFQTKDCENILTTIKINSTISSFYTDCCTCGCWIEFNRIDENLFKREVQSKNFKILNSYTKIIKIGNK